MTEDNKGFTCPNPSCGKDFANPIKTKNLGQKKVKVYDACPYCLTEINVEKSVAIIENKQKQETNRFEVEEASVHSMEGASKSLNKGCAHYFGYLSKRSAKEKIPEECIICENIVRCMLNNVTE